MKTLDEIINRSDYKAMNKALKERCFELARIIRRKMADLEVETITVNGHSYGRTSVTSSVATCDYLSVVHCEDGYYEQHLSLEQDYFEYYTGDFNAPIYPAKYKECLCFMNDMREILNTLDAIETQKVQDIKNAIISAESAETNTTKK